MEQGSEANGRLLGNPYPAELRERSVRMMLERRGDYRTELQAVRSIASKMGVHLDTLKVWARRTEVDAGRLLLGPCRTICSGSRSLADITRRRDSALGFLAPAEFERRWTKDVAA